LETSGSKEWNGSKYPKIFCFVFWSFVGGERVPYRTLAACGRSHNPGNTNRHRQKKDPMQACSLKLKDQERDLLVRQIKTALLLPKITEKL
jgi:hypothetical protein